jgi:hypothetical protein
VAALDLLKTQTENEPQSSQSKRQKPKITSQAHQTTVLRSLHLIICCDHDEIRFHNRSETDIVSFISSG